MYNFNGMTIDIPDQYKDRCYPTSLFSSYCYRYDELIRLLHAEFPNFFTRQCPCIRNMPSYTTNGCSIVIVFDSVDDLLMFKLKYGNTWQQV